MSTTGRRGRHLLPNNTSPEGPVDIRASCSHWKTNRKVFELLEQTDWAGRTIVDVGAGEGFFCSMMGEHLKERRGLRPEDVLRGCDHFPERFRYPDVPCDPIDANGFLPYGDETFDAVVCIEVIEHIEDQFKLVRELHRITRPEGRVIVTTPNLLNINSRLRFFFSGFWLLFAPLPLRSKDPVHLGGHIHPVSFYYLAYMFYRAGFREVRVHFDRFKRSAIALCVPFYLPILLADRIGMLRLRRKNRETLEENRFLLRRINSVEMLTARTVILEGIK